VPLYGELARLAAKALRRGGVLAAMCGQSYLPEVLAEMSKHLRYRWTLAVMTPKAVHTMARFTGRTSNAIPGTVFGVTATETQGADSYEVAAVKRVAVTLDSGIRAWAYVDAQHVPA
jgi:hypothetical protein